MPIWPGFDDESASEANEIDDISTNGRLPPEVEPKRLQLAQLHPKSDFLRRKTFAKCAGNFVSQDGPLLSVVKTNRRKLRTYKHPTRGTPTRPAFGRPPESELRSSRPHKGEG